MEGNGFLSAIWAGGQRPSRLGLDAIRNRIGQNLDSASPRVWLSRRFPIAVHPIVSIYNTSNVANVASVQ
jgi:hypothetical protein